MAVTASVVQSLQKYRMVVVGSGQIYLSRAEMDGNESEVSRGDGLQDSDYCSERC